MFWFWFQNHHDSEADDIRRESRESIQDLQDENEELEKRIVKLESAIDRIRIALSPPVQIPASDIHEKENFIMTHVRDGVVVDENGVKLAKTVDYEFDDDWYTKGENECNRAKKKEQS